MNKQDAIDRLKKIYYDYLNGKTLYIVAFFKITKIMWKFSSKVDREEITKAVFSDA